MQQRVSCDMCNGCAAGDVVMPKKTSLKSLMKDNTTNVCNTTLFINVNVANIWQLLIRRALLTSEQFNNEKHSK